MRQSQQSLPWDISDIAIPSSSSAAALGCSHKLIRVSGSGRAPGGENGKPLQYPCLENPTDRGAWQDTLPGLPKSWTRLKWLSTHQCKHNFTIQTLAFSGLLLDHHAGSFNTQVCSLSRCIGGSEAHNSPYVLLIYLLSPLWPRTHVTFSHRCSLSELPLFLEVLRLKKDLASIL